MSEYNNYKKAKIKLYQQLIEKLIYLLYDTRPNISFAIDQLSKHNSNSRMSYIRVAKKVIYYLKGNIYLELIYRA